MATEVTLPALGESVTEGTVTRWLKQVGDTVAVDEPLLEVSTDKVDTEIPSPVAGTLLEIKAEEDETVEVGAELAIVGDGEAGGSDDTDDADDADDADESADEPEDKKAPEPEDEEEPEPEPEDDAEPDEDTKTEAKEQSEPAGDEAPAPSKADKQDGAGESGGSGGSGGSGESRGYVTPLVRKLAAEHDVDLSTVEGTGVGGRIRKQDVLEAAKAKQSQAPAGGSADAAGKDQGAGAAGSPWGRHSPIRRRCYRQQDVRLRHEDCDARP